MFQHRSQNLEKDVTPQVKQDNYSKKSVTSARCCSKSLIRGLHNCYHIHDGLMMVVILPLLQVKRLGHRMAKLTCQPSTAGALFNRDACICVFRNSP